MSIYTLENDFHGSSVRVRAAGLSRSHNDIEVPLSPRQAARARRVLCGIEACTCADTPAGTRGVQTHDGKRVRLTFDCLV